MEVICFAWGGCGNFIKQCLTSDTTGNQTVDFYNRIDVVKTYTSQEWSIRNDKIYVLKHDVVENNAINLVWDDSLTASFHYVIKNIVLNHLDGTMLERVNGVIQHNRNLDQRLRQRPHVIIDNLLKDSNSLFDFCFEKNPQVSKDQIEQIHALWKNKTRLYYDAHGSTVLEYFRQLGLDYSEENLYNILYENTNTG
jgi:hypothetical protein